MKVVLVAHGYPPELVGGTEKSVQALARGLSRRGAEVVVVAGSIRHEEGFRVSEEEDVADGGAPIRVLRIHRADTFFDHWQKSASDRVAEAFREILRAERPDLVHVHHWIRLTRDLVAQAAREGVPAAVTLHDMWTSCLISFRVRPRTQELCTAPLAPSPCLDCAGQVPPRTPWVSRENQMMALAERKADLIGELRLARAVLSPSRAHAESVAGFLGLGLDDLSLRVVAPGRDLALSPRPGPEPPEESGRLLVGCWGHLQPLKGQELIVEAMRLMDRASDVELHLAGGEVEPGYAERFRRLASGLDVRLHGPFAEGELETHPVGDVHVMVSGTRGLESWGLIVDEAAALRIPMVLPRSGAFPERLAEGEGVLYYEQSDARSLATCLERLLEEPGLWSGIREGLPPLASLVPTLDDHVERVLAVYRDVVGEGAPDAGPEDWWRGKLRRTSEEQWDADLSRRTPAELGFEEGRS